MKILLIDDNPEITDLFETTLSAKGYPCQITNDGRKGLELIKKKESDLVLLDLAIPRFSGTDILRELLKDGPIDDYNIYIFTASVVSEEEVNEFLKMGVIECLRKPVRLDQLLEILEQYQARK